VLGIGALDDKPPLLETVNDESDCGIGTGSGIVAFTLRVFLEKKNYLFNKSS
jgi:hypothetical protein